jgi:nucleoside-diphosphate-sugar epimerase
MKILITGANGFIGSFLAEAALQKGWEVWAGVRKTSKTDYLDQLGLKRVILNYDDEREFVGQVRQHQTINGSWDFIIHNAGITKALDDESYYRINYDYTVRLVRALVSGGNKTVKFLYMSSMGAVGPGDGDTGIPLNADSVPNPISIYGRSKLKAEDYLRELTDFPWIILRPTGVYGPRERDYYQMFRMIRLGINVTVGLKPQRLNFIYVKDLAEMCIRALESGWEHKTWFVADGDYYSSDEFSEWLKKTLQKRYVLTFRVPLFVVHGISIVSEAIGRLTGKPALLNRDKYLVMKQRNWTCDSSLIETDLGFKPAYNLQKGLRETLEWYTKNGWL